MTGSLIVEKFEPLHLPLRRGRLTEFGREFFASAIDFEALAFEARIARRRGIGGGSGSYTNNTTVGSPRILAKTTGQDNASWANLSPVFFTLLTVVPDSSKNAVGALPSTSGGNNIVEANFTGMARYSMANTAWNSPTAGGAGVASSITNNGTMTMAACSGGSSTVIAWALVDQASSSGNVIAWGSCTSVVISTTQTPPTVANAALSITLL